ncbi:conserved hypothetical protein [Vibrio jasicida]|uniref:hypothetical protein n=1 Tax=Vibrio jasicida TaxID=766224 RepID=UPI0028958086|nr:conserved hypothetical protein [Vibrio jasicida]
MMKEQHVFYATSPDSIEDFLRTEISVGKHIYCAFTCELLDDYLIASARKRQIVSIRFKDGQTIYP